jgi:hypothetical protein
LFYNTLVINIQKCFQKYLFLVNMFIINTETGKRSSLFGVPDCNAYTANELLVRTPEGDEGTTLRKRLITWTVAQLQRKQYGMSLTLTQDQALRAPNTPSLQASLLPWAMALSKCAMLPSD